MKTVTLLQHRRNQTPFRKRPKLLLVHDEAISNQALHRALVLQGFDVLVAHSISDAFTVANRDMPGYALICLRSPRLAWLALIAQLKTINRHTRIVLLCEDPPDRAMFEAVKLGATHCQCDPLNVDRIILALNGLPTGTVEPASVS